MGPSVAGIGLDLNLCAMTTVGGFLEEAAAAVESVDSKVAKLEESVRSLEEERRKIEAFKRELPLCMLLITDVIEGLKKELERCRGERFARACEAHNPINSKCGEEGGVKLESESKNKTRWMSSAQLWTTVNNDKDDYSITEERNAKAARREEESLFSESKSRRPVGAFVPLKGMSPFVMNSKEEVKPRVMLPDLPLPSPAVKNAFCPISAVAEDHSLSLSGSQGVGGAAASALAMAGTCLSLQVQQQQQQQQPPRKARRCWSPELHRRFVLALQQLGGAQVATPKQIRELMQVDGLTNDEVKSHLQKYRLHARKMPNSSPIVDQPVVVLRGLWVPPENYTTSPQQSVSLSGSPQSPLQLAGSNLAVSATAGDSCEEDGRSECCNWTWGEVSAEHI
ncbi:transcription factor HHO2-like [Musa acuminata AAA Group]|uniref:transcription factor HHO2-like n=1 Tax=Musa acuminata AAA Group TaxID=214697 RepID=UPI0031E22A1E